MPENTISLMIQLFELKHWYKRREKEMERLRALIGKRIIKHQLSTDELVFHTDCGETIRILSNELEGWVDFNFDPRLSSMLEESKIHHIGFYRDGTIFHFGESYNLRLYASGIKRVRSVNKSEDGLEMLLEIETHYGVKETIHYFKHENTWRIANFRQTIEDIYLKIAKKYDIINHPSVRIKTLV